MTALELINKMNTEFELDGYPQFFEVDHETYANCCQFVFNYLNQENPMPGLIIVRLGRQGGLLFRNVELILKEK
jgi:hypothetical protein